MTQTRDTFLRRGLLQLWSTVAIKSLLLGCLRTGEPSQYMINHQDKLSLPSLRGR